MSGSTHALDALFRETELVVSEGGAFTVDIAHIERAASTSLVIDVYALDHPVHPGGHVGWWQCALPPAGSVVTGRLVIAEGGCAIVFDSREVVADWVNPAPVAGSAWVVSAVLRELSTNAILSIDRVPAFVDRQQVDDVRRSVDRDWEGLRLAMANFIAPADAGVRIVSRNMFVRDAVGNLCFEVFHLLRQNGIDATLYAEQFDLALNDLVRSVRRLGKDIAPTDTILYFFSTADPFLPLILDLQCRAKVAYFHGITRPEAVRVFDPELAAACANGIEQIPLLQRFDRLAANSRVNAGALASRLGTESGRRIEDIRVIVPRLFSCATAFDVEAAPTRPGVRMLSVGRIKSHKKIEQLLELLTELLKRDGSAELAIVGAGGDKAYADYLAWVQRDLGLPEETVHWCGGLDADALMERYRWASVYVAMSEDEGFGLPLLEAMMCGLPVMAYDIPTAREVLGAAGLRFGTKDFAHLARRLIHVLSTDRARKELVEKSLIRARSLLAESDGAGFLSLLFP